jgi:glucans biosynthesis protein C
MMCVLAMEGVTRSPSVANTLLGWRAFGGWPLPQHFIFFLMGYTVALFPQLTITMEACRKAALVAGISIVALAYWLILGRGQSGEGVFFTVLRSINVIVWLVAILGYGSRYLNFQNGCLRYANEAVLPFYILHQTVILGIGFFVVQWKIGIPAKFLIIALSSFTSIMVTYQLVIRPINAVRLLFGMKARPSHTTAGVRLH